MKERTGYVSNSSSASFILQKSKMTEAQIQHIESLISAYKGIHYIKLPGTLPGLESCGETWEITENTEFIKGETFMDNCELSKILDNIGVKEEATIEWSHD